MSPWKTARIVRAALGLLWARTIAGAVMMVAAARPPCMMLRRVILAMVPLPNPAWPDCFAAVPSLLPLSHLRDGAATVLSKDQARPGLLVERPDRPRHLGVWNFSIIAAEGPVGIDVDHPLGDRAIG